eukprot:CAMPEP_0168390760 /NCGR_PEP_ID=MMETSP0228-20121227/17639_1 /TAXON_ID=133427 /ORGANISM="Protoceratium reticulatum, Strain CCCM 535 (=CCMP 1889)" /LENGTH=139 /DNA_ID=CAMNT_0008404061 /DNA_START=83 /DNA_END=502 /DNA_ORIENTATION=+
MSFATILPVLVLLLGMPGLCEECEEARCGSPYAVLMQVRTQRVKTEAPAGRGVIQAVDSSVKPNGGLLMNRTVMDQSQLPEDVRHINHKTVTSDWREEYPLAGQVPSNTTLEPPRSGAASWPGFWGVLAATLAASTAGA